MEPGTNCRIVVVISDQPSLLQNQALPTEEQLCRLATSGEGLTEPQDQCDGDPDDLDGQQDDQSDEPATSESKAHHRGREFVYLKAFAVHPACSNVLLDELRHRLGQPLCLPTPGSGLQQLSCPWLLDRVIDNVTRRRQRRSRSELAGATHSRPSLRAHGSAGGTRRQTGPHALPGSAAANSVRGEQQRPRARDSRPIVPDSLSLSYSGTAVRFLCTASCRVLCVCVCVCGCAPPSGCMLHNPVTVE